MSTSNNRKNQTTGDGESIVPKKKETNKNNFKRQKAMQKAEEAARQLRSESHSLGSYTGLAHDGDIPEQDADDL